MTERNYELDYAIASNVDQFNDPRDVRALTEPMQLEDGDGADDYVVHSASGRTYNVNTRYGRCSCFDCSENGNHCKHLRAVTFHQGLRPVPVAALFLDDVAAEVVAEENDVDADESEVDAYAEIQMTGVNGLEPRTKWVNRDGELVAESEPEPGDAIDAEREMVEDQEQQAAADGGDAEICGAETARGAPCQRKGDCPYHGDDGDESADDDDDLTIDVDADGDAETALADAATATDGGAVIETENADVLDRVLELADDRPLVVVITN